jgi:hypothetical protein
MKIKSDTTDNKLTDEEIAQVMSLYPNCPVLIFDAPQEAIDQFGPIPDFLDNVSYGFDKVGAEHTYFKKTQVKLVLKQLQHITDNEIFWLCYWYSSDTFKGTDQKDWKIKREGFEIKVFQRAEGLGFVIDTDTFDINLLRNGMRTHLGTTSYAFQWYLRNYYAIPLFFGKGHWANKKTALQLEVAVPDQEPLKKALMKMYDNDATLVEVHYRNLIAAKLDIYNVDVYNEELSRINKQLISHR